MHYETILKVMQHTSVKEYTARLHNHYAVYSVHEV